MKVFNWISLWLPRTYKAVVAYLFFLITAALLYMSAFSTCFIGKNEKTYFLPDTPWMKLLGVVLLLIVLIYIYISCEIKDLANKQR